MNKPNVFGELDHFKKVVQDPKRRDAYEGVNVVLQDADTGINFNLPVGLISKVRDAEDYKQKNTTRIWLRSGEVYQVKGNATTVFGKIIDAKIKGGRN